jgi:hypothetical protein
MTFVPCASLILLAMASAESVPLKIGKPRLVITTAGLLLAEAPVSLNAEPCTLYAAVLRPRPVRSALFENSTAADRLSANRPSASRFSTDRFSTDRFLTDRFSTSRFLTNRFSTDRFLTDRFSTNRFITNRFPTSRRLNALFSTHTQESNPKSFTFRTCRKMRKFFLRCSRL